ncbi:MAG TPA: DUF5990 family protein [Acidobacteriaceae bacterium]|jgi:hypothetical protein|nr:DUF5990 family protein [Acidobacteriaceae bacterium]
MAAKSEVRMRLIRADDVPASHAFPEEEVQFGLQDTKGVIVPGERGAKGEFIFDFTLTVRRGAKGNGPVFTGRFASGTAEDRFVYLSWWSVPRGVWINRVKARLGAIDWEMVRAAQKADRPIVADMTGWTPGDKRKQVAWRVE